MIQQLRHAVVAPTGVGKNDGSMMHRGGWWSKRWCMMVLVQDLYLMLQFLGLLSQATVWNSQKISIIMFSVCSTNIFSFVLNTRRMMTTTHWLAKTWCNKALPTSLKCHKNGWRNFWIIPYSELHEWRRSIGGNKDKCLNAVNVTHWSVTTLQMH